ncbi:hypothetical protein [Saccharopolyspora hattusasensis]|uniref:hypothetical protein n=1 Tax=Saccharopolyspora hattusasensis TaxID=1128679 RepID=UPI003D9606DF
MSAVAWPDHLLSLKDWAELPEDNIHRVELVEGTLHVSPRSASDHQWALKKLTRQLDDQVPQGAPDRPHRTPGEVAETIAFLVSDAASIITGAGSAAVTHQPRSRLRRLVTSWAMAIA